MQATNNFEGCSSFKLDHIGVHDYFPHTIEEGIELIAHGTYQSIGSITDDFSSCNCDCLTRFKRSDTIIVRCRHRPVLFRIVDQCGELGILSVDRLLLLLAVRIKRASIEDGDSRRSTWNTTSLDSEFDALGEE